MDRNFIRLKSKADSTRALKTRQLRRPTKRVATATELSNDEIYKSARSNLDERFWCLESDVSPASSDSNAVGRVFIASVHNAVQSTLKRFIRLSQRGVQIFVHDVRFRKIYLRGRDLPTFIQCSIEGIFEQRSERRDVSKFSLCRFFFM